MPLIFLYHAHCTVLFHFFAQGVTVALLLIVFGLNACAQDDAEKLPPPSDEQRAAVMKLLQEIYGPKYAAATSPSDKSALASEIIEAANETADSHARYVMMKLATDIAVRAGDAQTVGEAINLLDKFYQIDAPKVRLAALMGTVKHVPSDDESVLLDAVVDFCQQALDRNDFESAENLLRESLLRFRMEPSRRRLQAFADRVRKLKSQFDSVRDSLQRLVEDPDDMDANLAVGKYRCFDRQEWAEGLPNLAKGSDAELSEIAKMELARRDDPAEQLAIADRWWNYAENADAEHADLAGQAKLRAGSYYQLALPSLRGLQKAKAAARLKEAKSSGIIAAIKLDGKPPKPAGDPAQPAPMAQRKVTYEFPASFTDVAVGGSGKYLILRLDALKKLAFFDVHQRKITEYVSIESSDVRFAAGAKEFVIATRPQNVMERWSLETFKRLSTVKLPLDHPVEAIAMGHASDGPIYAGAAQGNGLFLNGRSLRPGSYQVVDHRYQRAGEVQGAGPASRVRASANGRAFAMWRTNVSPGGFRTYIVADRLIHTFYQHDTMGYIEPSPDGELMYTSRGIYTSQTKPYLANEGNTATSFRIPAVTGNYAIGIPRDDNRDRKNVTAVHLLVSGQLDPILTIPDVSIRPGEYGDFHGREILTLARRVYLLPEANLIITLPESNKSLILHRFHLEQELDASGVDYLYVASRPPTVIRAGSYLKYQIEVKSKHGNLEYEIVAGPSGMKVNSQGLVTWRSPRRREDHEVIVAIKDGRGNQATHTFSVATVD